MAKLLLADGAVDVVIGYRKGTVAMREQPFMARTAEEADELAWSGFCCNNLANFMVIQPRFVGHPVKRVHCLTEVFHARSEETDQNHPQALLG